jgi:hypothetical protein
MTPVPSRRKPVQRIGPRLAGFPPEADAVPTLAAPAEPLVDHTPEPVAAKRGPKPKGERPMTPAERKAKQRAMKAEKAADVQRRDIVAQLVKINRRRLSKADLKSPNAHEVLANNRVRLRKMRDEWVLLPLEELQKTLRTYDEIKDSTGRLHGEASGEKDRSNGMSHPEKIIAASENQQHGGFDDAAGTSRGGDLVDNYNTEQGTTGETTGRPPRGLLIPREHTDYLDRRELIIGKLIEKHTKREADGGRRCLLCSESELVENTDGTKSRKFIYPVLIPGSDVREHFWREYDKGLQAFYRYQELSEDSGVVELAQFLVDDARRAYQNSKHLQAVWDLSRKLK